MKRILQVLCAFAFLFALAFPVQQASAQPMYFDDAQNYLVWDRGSHRGSAVDLSSAVVVKDTSKYTIIAALNNSVAFAWPKEGVEPSITPMGTIYFKEYKNGSGLYWGFDWSPNYDSGKWYQVTSYNPRTREAYPLIKARAIQNTKNIN